MNRVFLLFLCIVICVHYSYGQTEYSKVYEDFGVWSSVSVGHKINKKWQYKGSLAYRLKNNATELRTTFLQVNINRDLKKKWDVGAAVRYSWKPNSQIIRFSPILKKYFRFKPINVLYRLKADFNHELFDSRAELDTRIRNRFGVEYSRKKHDLSGGLFVEWFHDHDRHILWANNIRYKAVMEYKINKEFRVKASYIIQQELNTTKPVRDYIIRWNLHYKF